MTDTTIRLDHYRPNNPGNGALPIVREYFDRMPRLPKGLHRGDQFLAWLWTKGFMVAPLTKQNELQAAWDAGAAERQANHEAAILELGRKPRLR